MSIVEKFAFYLFISHILCIVKQSYVWGSLGYKQGDFVLNNRSLLIRHISLVLIATFLCQELSYSAPAILTPAALSDSVASFQAPTEFCSLKEFHQGQVGKPLIIHIQDAHSNLSGQENLAKTLDQIMTKYSVSTVLVEGGGTDGTLDPLKQLASPEIIRRIAKKLLIEGKLAGEEYLNLTSDHPMKIQGIEDMTLYKKSVENYAKLADRREAIQDYLSVIERSAEKLKRKLYPQELISYEAQKQKDTDGALGFKFKELLSLAKLKEVEITNFPNLQKLSALEEKEKSIDFNLANLEQAALMEKINTTSSPKSLIGDQTKYDSRLKLSGMTVDQFTFFRNILNIAKEKNIATEEYPNLLRYFNYLKDFTDLDLEEVLNEFEHLEDKVYVAWLPKEDSRLLRAIDRYLALLKIAYRIQMSTKDFEFFKANEPDFSTASYQAFLNRKLIELGYFEDVIPYKNILEEGKKALEDFYDSVSQRDLAFIQNTKRILGDSVIPAKAGIRSSLGADSRFRGNDNANIAVLITGGYHTSHLKKLFQQEGFSYVVLTPIVTAETNQKKYENLLLSSVRKESKTIEVVQGESKQNKTSVQLDVDLLKIAKKEGARFAGAVMTPARLAQTLESFGGLNDRALNTIQKEFAARLANNISEETKTPAATRLANEPIASSNNPSRLGLVALTLNLRVALWKLSLYSGFSFGRLQTFSWLEKNDQGYSNSYWLSPRKTATWQGKQVIPNSRLRKSGIQLHTLALTLLDLMDQGLSDPLKEELFRLLEKSVAQHNLLAQSEHDPGAKMSLPLLLVRATSVLIRPDSNYVRLSRAMMQAPKRFLKPIAILQLRAKQIHLNFIYLSPDIVDFYASHEAIKFILEPENIEDPKLKSALIGFLAGVFKKKTWQDLAKMVEEYGLGEFDVNSDDSKAMFDDFKTLLKKHDIQMVNWMKSQALSTGLERIGVQFLPYLELSRLLTSHSENLESLLLDPQSASNQSFFLKISKDVTFGLEPSARNIVEGIYIQEDIDVDQYYQDVSNNFMTFENVGARSANSLSDQINSIQIDQALEDQAGLIRDVLQKAMTNLFEVDSPEYLRVLESLKKLRFMRAYQKRGHEGASSHYVPNYISLMSFADEHTIIHEFGHHLTYALKLNDPVSVMGNITEAVYDAGENQRDPTHFQIGAKFVDDFSAEKITDPEFKLQIMRLWSEREYREGPMGDIKEAYTSATILAGILYELNGRDKRKAMNAAIHLSKEDWFTRALAVDRKLEFFKNLASLGLIAPLAMGSYRAAFVAYRATNSVLYGALAFMVPIISVLPFLFYLGPKLFTYWENKFFQSIDWGPPFVVNAKTKATLLQAEGPENVGARLAVRDELAGEISRGEWDLFERRFEAYDRDTLLSLLTTLSQMAHDSNKNVTTEISGDAARRIFGILSDSYLIEYYQDPFIMAWYTTLAQSLMVLMPDQGDENTILARKTHEETTEMVLISVLAHVKFSDLLNRLVSDFEPVRHRRVVQALFSKFESEDESAEDIVRVLQDDFTGGHMFRLFLFIWQHFDQPFAQSVARLLRKLNRYLKLIGQSEAMLLDAQIEIFRSALFSDNVAERKIAIAFFSEFIQGGVTDTPEFVNRLKKLYWSVAESLDIYDQSTASYIRNILFSQTHSIDAADLKELDADRLDHHRLEYRDQGVIDMVLYHLYDSFGFDIRRKEIREQIIANTYFSDILDIVLTNLSDDDSPFAANFNYATKLLALRELFGSRGEGMTPTGAQEMIIDIVVDITAERMDDAARLASLNIPSGWKRWAPAGAVVMGLIFSSKGNTLSQVNQQPASAVAHDGVGAPEVNSLKQIFKVAGGPMKSANESDILNIDNESVQLITRWYVGMHGNTQGPASVMIQTKHALITFVHEEGDPEIQFRDVANTAEILGRIPLSVDMLNAAKTANEEAKALPTEQVMNVEAEALAAAVKTRSINHLVVKRLFPWILKNILEDQQVVIFQAIDRDRISQDPIAKAQMDLIEATIKSIQNLLGEEKKKFVHFVFTDPKGVAQSDVSRFNSKEFRKIYVAQPNTDVLHQAYLAQAGFFALPDLSKGDGVVPLQALYSGALGVALSETMTDPLAWSLNKLIRPDSSSTLDPQKDYPRLKQVTNEKDRDYFGNLMIRPLAINIQAYLTAARLAIQYVESAA